MLYSCPFCKTNLFRHAAWPGLARGTMPAEGSPPILHDSLGCWPATRPQAAPVFPVSCPSVYPFSPPADPFFPAPILTQPTSHAAHKRIWLHRHPLSCPSEYHLKAKHNAKPLLAPFGSPIWLVVGPSSNRPRLDLILITSAFVCTPQGRANCARRRCILPTVTLMTTRGDGRTELVGESMDRTELNWKSTTQRPGRRLHLSKPRIGGILSPIAGDQRLRLSQIRPQRAAGTPATKPRQPCGDKHTEPADDQLETTAKRLTASPGKREVGPSGSQASSRSAAPRLAPLIVAAPLVCSSASIRPQTACLTESRPWILATS